MGRPPTVADLFQDEPRRWGLRGDPHLWREMRLYFESVRCPSSAAGLVSLIAEAFEELSGLPMSHTGPIYVERYDHGGMSSGYVQPTFWREKAVPLLQSRLMVQGAGNA